ncbi:DUF1559 domain-containing protein [Bremerella sp. JC817]|uniref:DUF1559 family PulG-like putative transporter n=1 Tax=Bremerella sp. JC817 TaxID=3231756 RepID=UPI0034597272
MDRHRSFGLSDLLVIATALLLLAAIAAPWVAMARDEARAKGCQDHMRTIAKACRGFAEVHQDSLPSNRRQPHTGWNTLVLPFMDQAKLYDKYDLSLEWYEGGNRDVGMNALSTLVCPAAPHADRVIRLLDPDGKEFSAKATDYVASSGAYLHTNQPERLYRGAMASPGRHYGASNVTAGHAVRLNEITDGLANTFLVVEMADKPNGWRAGKLHDDKTADQTHRPLVDGFSFGQWIAPNWNHLRSYDQQGQNQFGDCAVNCSNEGSIYSFHPGKAYAAMADGSAMPIRAGLEQEVLIALVSIADGELIATEDFQAD